MFFDKTRLKLLEAFEQAIWKRHALYFGAIERTISGMSVICKYNAQDLVKESLLRLEEFDTDLWIRLRDSINMIIFIERGDSGIIPGKGIILVSEKDQSHISTATHLASWLLYYLEKLDGVKEAGIVNWYKTWNAEVETRAQKIRNEFLTGPRLETSG